ncbi:hypothetical protein M9Y10_029416 [Tritrichomonas musculus]|uniref:Transposase n=1 Tax=Tritrichomonas musculus TaxID=1915356 RepID=A0ABR2KM07_9EUKA
MSKFSLEVAKIIRNVMLSSEFRNARTPFEKVTVLVNSGKHISIQNTCKAIGISTKRYYKIKNKDDSDDDESVKDSNRQLLTNKEEFEIIQNIECAQLKCECLRGKMKKN